MLCRNGGTKRNTYPITPPPPSLPSLDNTPVPATQISSPSTDARRSCTRPAARQLSSIATPAYRNALGQDRQDRQTYLEEAGHGLVGTADLHLEEGGLVAVAALGGALGLALLRVVPGARPAEDVLLLLAVEVAAREERLVADGVLVGAGAALEPVAARVRGRDGQDVGALRADCLFWFGSRSERVGAEVDEAQRQCGREKGLTEQHLESVGRGAIVFSTLCSVNVDFFPPPCRDDDSSCGNARLRHLMSGVILSAWVSEVCVIASVEKSPKRTPDK